MDPVQNKLKLLFDKMKEPGYVMNNYYADGLINKLADGSEPDLACLKTLNLIADLVTASLEHSESRHITVQVFLTRMLAISCQKELYFTKIVTKRGDEILKGFKGLNSPGMNLSLRVAYMEVALALVSHDSGTSWLLETGVWKEILNLCNEKQTVFVVRQTYKFASTLVWKLNDTCDEANLRIILDFIVKPIRDTDLLNKCTLPQEEEESLCRMFEPILQILLSIVTVVPKIQQTNLVIAILAKEYAITSHLCIIMDRLRKENIMLLLGKLTFWIIIAKVYLTKPLTPGVEYSAEDFIELSAMYFNTIQIFVARRSANVILDFCTSCNVIWLTICKNDPMKHTLNQCTKNFLFMCLVPTLVYIRACTVLKNIFHDSVKCERMESFIAKMVSSACEHIARAAYSLRDLTLELDTVSITVQSVKRLTCLKNLLNDEQANVVFQGLFYILTAYDPTNQEVGNEENCGDCEEKALVISYVLDMVHYLVKNHNINWHETLEVICLYNIVYNILKRPNLSVKFIVTALNVITTTIKKFLPPNLSLLMESKPGSSIHELGNLIYMKMHDMHWEVRDSALELLLVVTEISYIKFPSFQKKILDNNLINVSATIAFNDHESYVQASALKCVGAATKVGAVWDQLITQYPDIQDQLISILRNNQEGIVRKEACCVLREVYQNVSPSKLPTSFKHTLYDHMASSALSDFHWEVQLSALKFWRMVIQSLLNDQGMLDGTFPPVTFSKESRKIVTLNEAEIQKRLLKILDELASIGCLTVLIKLLHEDTEVEIIEAALSISLDLLSILNKYKVPDVIKRSENDVTIEELINSMKDEEVYDHDMDDSENDVKSESIIDGILNADDVNLLANIYESHMKIQSEQSLKTTKSEQCTPKIKLLKCASPYLFINDVKNTDFRAVVEQKKKWKDGIRSISSLLDDVLGIYEINDEVNTLDCY